MVSSHLHYFNSLFRRLSSFSIHKLQCIQNTLGEIVTNCNRYSPASPFLKQLHWLPVEFRRIFKTATLVYKFVYCGHASYFGPLLSIRCGRYGIRYNHPERRFLEVPQYYSSVHKSKKQFGHSFVLMLPDDVRSAPILACFRKMLKSYLFR